MELSRIAQKLAVLPGNASEILPNQATRFSTWVRRAVHSIALHSRTVIDTGSPVDFTYELPYKFTIAIQKITFDFKHMNLKLKELIRTILQRDGEGSLELLYGNYSACLRHLVGYLSQKDGTERKALLAVLRNMAFNKHQDVDRPIDEATIGREMKNTFRKLLLQELGTTMEGDIDTLYEAIEKGEIK